MAGEACHRHKKSPQKIAAAISSRAVSSLAAAATRSRPPRLTAGAASSTMNAILALLLVCACAGCASAAPTLLLAACMMKERGVHMRVEEFTEMIGVACNTLTDFDIQLVVDADMRRWVKKKLPQLCDRVDLATLNMTLNMKEGTLEHMREVRSFKVRAIEKYARIHASNGLIYLDNDVHIQPRAQADFLAVFQAMRSARASVALRRAKCCIPKGHEIAGIPNTFCERQGGTMFLHGASGTEFAQAWTGELSKNVSPDGHDQVSLRKVLWDFTQADHNLLYDLPERLICKLSQLRESYACDSCAVVHGHHAESMLKACKPEADGQLVIGESRQKNEKKRQQKERKRDKKRKREEEEEMTQTSNRRLRGGGSCLKW